MYSKQIYKLENGYGYRILYGENIIREQDFHPNKSGITTMTELEANKLADDKIEELLKPVPINLDVVRVERNRLLTECDWTQLPDSPLSSEQTQEWVIYRQQLRDLPEMIDLYNPVYPSKPI